VVSSRRTTRLLLVIVAALILTTTASESRADLVVLTEGQFSSSEWTALVTTGSLGDGSVSYEATGGNPADFLSVEWDYGTTPQSVAVFHSSPLFSYDPSTSGSIESIDLSIDHVSLVGHGLGQGFRFAIRQNGMIYLGGPGFLVTCPSASWPACLLAGWESRSFSGYSEGDFGELTGIYGQDSGKNPDFSGSGSTIELGLLTWEDIYYSDIHSGYDNLTYSLETTPPVLAPPVPSLNPLGIAILLSLMGFMGYRRLRA
jgi:hypothetical protein